MYIKEAPNLKSFPFPESQFRLPSQEDKKIEGILLRYPNKQAALLPVLWVCQRFHGWISPSIIDYVSHRLDVPTALVKGVVSFYSMFFTKPVGKNVIWICRTLSCELRGAKDLEKHLEKKLMCKVGQTSSDDQFTLLKAECLAACDKAPVLQINDEYCENPTMQQLDQILESLKRSPQ